MDSFTNSCWNHSCIQFRGYHPISLQLAEVLKITKFAKRPQEEESTDEQITKTEEIKEDAAWCLVWRFIPDNLVSFATFDPSIYPITKVHFPEILNKWNLKTLVFPNHKTPEFPGRDEFQLACLGRPYMQKTSRGLMYTKYEPDVTPGGPSRPLNSNSLLEKVVMTF